MSYYCNNCKRIIDEDDLAPTGIFFKGREYGACPHCHSEDLVEADECELCGKAVIPYEQFCDDCKEEMFSSWNWMVNELAKKHKKEFESMERLILDYMEREVF